MGIIIGSGIKLNDNKVPLTNWENTAIKAKKPHSAFILWKLTLNVVKYDMLLFIFIFK